MSPPPQSFLQQVLGVDGPAFVRKLRAKAHWGATTDPLEERIKVAVKEVFKDEQPPCSLFLVRSDTDFQRVTIGMNARRAIPGGPTPLLWTIDWVAFTPQEFEECQITPRHSPEDGETPCRHAKALHHDIEATEAQLTELCRRVMQHDRPVGHLNKTKLRPLANQATADQCLAAVPTASDCKAEGCPPSLG